MSDVKLDNEHRSAMQQLGTSLSNSFHEIDSDHNGNLTKDELQQSIESNRLNSTDKVMAKFAAEHIGEIAALYQGMNTTNEEANLPKMLIGDKAQIEKDDLEVMKRAAGDTNAGDPFVTNRKIFVGANATLDAGYGAYAGSIGGPLGAGAGAVIGGLLGWGAFRAGHRIFYGSADNYYSQKAGRLQTFDLSNFSK